MKVKHGYPPNIEEIAAVLPDSKTNEDVLFCYGDTIYVPGGGRVPYQLKAHEAVHSRRQGTTDASIRAWWQRYLSDTAFRYNEELPAHRAEYAAFCENELNKHARFQFLVDLARRLSGTLYGAIISFPDAKRAIKEGL